MITHNKEYSVRLCGDCNCLLTYKGPNHKRTAKEAEQKGRLCKNCAVKGQKNPCYGRKGELHPFYGKKRPQHSKWLKDNNPMHNDETRNNYYIKQYGLTADDWYNSLSARKAYYLEVLRTTKKQPIELLENYTKIGRIEKDGYCVDHIYSKSKGFENNIPAELIGDIKNLQIILGKVNSKKREAINTIPKHIQDYLDANK